MVNVYRLEYEDGLGVYSRRFNYSDKLQDLLNDAPTINATEEGLNFSVGRSHHFAWDSLDQADRYFDGNLHSLLNKLVDEDIEDLFISIYEVPDEALQLNTANQVVFVKELSNLIRKEPINDNTIQNIIPNWLQM